VSPSAAHVRAGSPLCAGSTKDENDEGWLCEVEAVFAQHAEKLRAFHGH
jgi:hypothetical protein